MNKLDPRVDSDRGKFIHPTEHIHCSCLTVTDHRAAPGGMTGTTGTTMGAGAGGMGAGMMGTSTAGHHGHGMGAGTNTTAGPHDSNMANKMGPRVDSDRCMFHSAHICMLYTLTNL